MKNGNLIGGIITAVVVIAVTAWILNGVNAINDKFTGKTSVSDKIISGEYDSMIRQKCIERINSYGLGTVPEGSINLCVDTAKALAYSELNK